MRLPAICGIAGPVAFTAAWAVSSLRQTGHSATAVQLSGLAAADARDPEIMMAGFVALGACSIAFGVALGRVTGRRSAGPWLVMCAGAAVVAAGLLRRDHMLLTGPGFGGESWHNQAHDLASGIAYGAMIAAPLALARRFRGDPEWATVSRPLQVLALASAAVLVLFAAHAVAPWNGLVQRLAVTTALTAEVVAAARMITLRPGQPGMATVAWAPPGPAAHASNWRRRGRRRDSSPLAARAGCPTPRPPATSASKTSRLAVHCARQMGNNGRMADAHPIPAVAIADGVVMPLIGFGTWRLRVREAYESVRFALEVGYRHVDTATMYGNEAEVGRAIRDSGLDRGDIFVTTKLPSNHVGRERETIRASLRALRTDYVDLWLVHWPPRGKASPLTWREFMAVRDGGLARAIGVSNYTIAQIDELVSATGQAPAVNQIPWSPHRHDPGLLAAHRGRGVVVEGYSPLKRSDLADPVLAEVASRCGVTPAQVVLRWHIEHGIAVIPKSAQRSRIAANFDLFGFSLDAAEIARIGGGDRTVPRG